jgi:peptidoglycan/LPS O-acetylase OafA/YrhL
MSAGAAPGAPPVATGDTPDTVAPPPRHPRFPLIDGMRALAVLCVVLVHAGFFAGASASNLPDRLLAHLNIGVTIFFLISGFLLYRPFIAHRGGGPPAPAVNAYGKRRFLRIYPAYWLVLTVLLIVPGLPSADYEHVWPMYLIIHTLPVASGPRCSAQVTSCGLAQTWSLVAELSFYLALPLYVAITERVTRRLGLRGWAIAQAAVLALLSAVSVGLEFVVLDPAPQWFGWTAAGTLLWFALGMGLAVASVTAEGSGAAQRVATAAGRAGPLVWLAAAAGYVALCLWLPPSPFFLTRHELLAVHAAFAAIALLLLAPVTLAQNPGGIIAQLAGSRAMMWLGLISYGVFLWHYPVVLTLGPAHGTLGFLGLAAGTLVIAVACAAASYYVLERPVMRLKYRPLLARAPAGDASPS